MRPPTTKEMAQLTTTTMAVLEKVLGRKLMKQMLATMSDGSAWLLAPQTTIEALKDIFEQAKPVDEQEIEEFAEPRMRRFNEVVQRSLATNPILQARIPASLMRFLLQHDQHVDVARLEALKFEGMFDVLVPAEVVPRLVLDTRNLFEPSVREAGRFLCDSIERWYKSLVIFLVDLTCAARRCRRPKGVGSRTTLGGWLRAAERLWGPAGGANGVLDRNLLALRNFFSHQKPKIDVRAETIVSPFDDTKVLDRDGFAQLVWAHYFKLTALWLVLLAWKHCHEADGGREAKDSVDVEDHQHRGHGAQREGAAGYLGC
jgi:hypothetical protein